MIARRFMAETNVPYFSLDFLMMGLYQGIPELGVGPLRPCKEVAIKQWPILKGMCETIVYNGMDYLIEGDSILPVQVAELMQKEPDKVKACFIGYANISAGAKLHEIRECQVEPNDWLRKHTDEFILDFVTGNIEFSIEFQTDCSKYQIPYYDCSSDFRRTQDQVLTYLKENK